MLAKPVAVIVPVEIDGANEVFVAKTVIVDVGVIVSVIANDVAVVFVGEAVAVLDELLVAVPVKALVPIVEIAMLVIGVAVGLERFVLFKSESEDNVLELDAAVVVKAVEVMFDVIDVATVFVEVVAKIKIFGFAST